MDISPTFLLVSLVVVLVVILIVGVRAALSKKLATGDCIALFAVVMAAIGTLLTHSHKKKSDIGDSNVIPAAMVKVVGGPIVEDGAIVPMTSGFEWTDSTNGQHYTNGIMMKCTIVLSQPIKGELKTTYYSPQSLKMINASKDEFYDGFAWVAKHGRMQAADGAIPNEPFTQVFTIWVDPNQTVPTPSKIP